MHHIKQKQRRSCLTQEHSLTFYQYYPFMLHLHNPTHEHQHLWVLLPDIAT